MQLKQEERAAKICTPYWKPPIFYDDDDDDDEESSIPLKDIIFELPLSIAITPDFPITNSLIMEDEHLDTILETESDEKNKSSVKDLNLTPSDHRIDPILKKLLLIEKYFDSSSPQFDSLLEELSGILTAKVVDDISKHYVLMPSILPTYPTRCPVIDTLLPFSSKNENKVFNSGILASNKEKSPHLLSHRGFKAF
ncbi:hypothetical protein Tco_1002788 [Tanacetum coccineum]|uniref:Uncharacterized protein n=1 Tax=Tanacetum coccineum TaxID=301880 RepID=A0ABQ5F7J8_9ASTR